MNTTELTTTLPVPERPSFGDEVTEFVPYIAAIVVLGPITLLSLVLWAPFLLVLVLLAAPVVAAGIVGLCVAILATPFVLLHRWHQQRAERHPSPRRAPAIAGAVASVGGPQ
jgi:hypothetical protein